MITLQRILGHESLEVTKRYLQLTSAQVQIRYESFSPVDRLPLDGLRRFGNKKTERKHIRAMNQKAHRRTKLWWARLSTCYITN